MRSNPDHLAQLLEAVEGNAGPSQRALAAALGVSLGRLNHLMRGLITKQWVRAVPLGAHRVRYVLTPQGFDARERLSRDRLRRALESYGRIRNRICDRLQTCMKGRHNGTLSSAVVLYGVGDVAEIAFACAADAGLELIGFADDTPRQSFLGLPVRAPAELTTMALDGRRFDWLVVASLVNQEAVRVRLETVGFPLERVTWL